MFSKTYFYSFFFGVFLLIATLCSAQSETQSKLSSYMMGFDVFLGDKHGDFKGDLIAILSDGSAWKIHPNDREKASSWELDSSVHISLRTSFYWFKREHKFLLCNHDKGDSVKVMVVKYAESPLQIIETSGIYPTNMIEVEEYMGNDIRGYPIFEEEIIPTDFKKDIVLSDGTVWVIGEKFQDFRPEIPVYMGVKETEEGTKRFLICGNEREAVWTWITPRSKEID